MPIAIVSGFAVFAGLRLATAWSDLPARMASHFGPSGAADRFMARGAFVGFMAAVFCGVALLLLFGVPALIRVVPGAINLPNRDYWLSPERRERTIATLGAWTRWLAVPVAGLVALVVDLTIRANLARAGLDTTVFTAGLALYLVATGALILGLYREFRLPGRA